MNDDIADFTQYFNLLDSMGIKVLDYKLFGYHTGDYAVVVQNEDKLLGFVVIPFGSCPECDPLKKVSASINPNEELAKLVQKICDSIFWGSLTEVLEKIYTALDDDHRYIHDGYFENSKYDLINNVTRFYLKSKINR